MMQTVKGIYRDGKIELLESPSDVSESEVLVTFVRVSEEAAQTADGLDFSDKKTKMMRLGMFASSGESLTLEDCKIAEFHGDPDDGLDWS